MNGRDLVFFSILLALAAFIWGRDVSWLASSDAALPIFAALPLMVWLGWPWQLKQNPQSFPSWAPPAAAALFLGGILLDLTLLLVLGWNLLLAGWMLARIEKSRTEISRLLVLGLLAFPWITLDIQQLGWWFRLSGAIVTAQIFDATGYAVVRDGTDLLVGGHSISVEAACSGLQTLQSMLIAGVFAATVVLRNSRFFWFNIALLIPLAWLANTLRILLLTAATLWKGRAFAQGSFHEFGGLAVVILMFALCCLIFQAQRDRPRNPPPGPLEPTPIRL